MPSVDGVSDNVRVAIDARELQGQPTGVGRYLAGLLEAWKDLAGAQPHEFVLCAPTALDSGRYGRRVSTCISHNHWRRGGTYWEQSTLPRLARAARADVLFAPGYTGPVFGTIPMVVAIHDVSFAAHPEWFNRREGMRRWLLTRIAAWKAARILTISEFSKAEIVRHLGIAESKIQVSYPGVESGTATRRTAGTDPIVLYVGSLFTRRHIPELIAGFASLAREKPVHLEIVGDNRTVPYVDLEHLAATSGAGDRIALRSYVPDDVLSGLYARAAAFVFLSEYEGFGLTPLEALAAGIPIVVLDTAVAREVYGDAALYIERPDPALIRSAIESVLLDEAERTRILEAARRRLPRFSWKACAQQVLAVLSDASSQRDGR